MHNLFSPAQTKVFQQLASDISANYKEVESKSKHARGRVDILFSPWQITLDVRESENVDGRSYYTQIRVPFLQATSKPFNFEIYRDDIFTKIGKLFGMQDIIIGDRRFDKEFIIQGNQPEKVKLLMQESRIKEILTEKDHFHFKIDENGEKDHKELPDGVGLLSYSTGGVVSEQENLKLMVELMQTTLSHMVAVGIAKEEAPMFEL